MQPIPTFRNHAFPFLLSAVTAIAFCSNALPGRAAEMPPADDGSGGAMTRQAEEIACDLHFVTWTEPTEHAFSLSIPQGWKVKAYIQKTDRSSHLVAYLLTSPDKDITLFRTLSSLSFQEPRFISFLRTKPDGKSHQIPYLSAAEFNAYYLKYVLPKTLHNVNDVTVETWCADAPRSQQLASLFGGKGLHRRSVSVGISTFHAIDHESHKTIAGVIQSATISGERMPQYDEVSWSAFPAVVFYQSDGNGAQTAARARNAAVAFSQAARSYRMDPVWQEIQIQKEYARSPSEIAAGLKQMTALSQQFAVNSDTVQEYLLRRYPDLWPAGEEAPQTLPWKVPEVLKSLDDY